MKFNEYTKKLLAQQTQNYEVIDSNSGKKVTDITKYKPNIDSCLLEGNKYSDTEKKEISSEIKNKLVSTEIVPFNDNRFIYKNDLEKKFASLYVLEFIQNEDIFEYLKSIVDFEKEEEIEIKANNSTSSNSKKLASKDCKYLYMIIENPNNKNEKMEISLKVIDIIRSYKY